MDVETSWGAPSMGHTDRKVNDSMFAMFMCWTLLIELLLMFYTDWKQKTAVLTAWGDLYLYGFIGHFEFTTKKCESWKVKNKYFSVLNLTSFSAGSHFQWPYWKNVNFIVSTDYFYVPEIFIFLIYIPSYASLMSNNDRCKFINEENHVQL